ncbi:MAG: RluA family pseudouridine synthase [bacterium]
MIPWHPQVKIIKEQTDVFMVYKPCGVLSHPNKAGLCKQSLIQAPYDFSQQAYRTSDGLIYLLNRLDSPTSGLVVLCKNNALAQQIRKLFKEHNVKKVYHAVVKGRFTGKNVCWQDKVQIEKSEPYLRTYRTSGTSGVWAKTIVNLIQNFNLHGEAFSLIQLEPLTGRTHQLRVQCAQHHFPILGDKTYGDFKCNRRLKADRLFLHACSTEFTLEGQTFTGYCDSGFSEWLQADESCKSTL